MTDGELLPADISADDLLAPYTGDDGELKGPETDFFGGLGLIGEAIMEAPAQIKGSMAASARAGRNVLDENHYKRWVDEAQASADAFMKEGGVEDENKLFISTPIGDISYKDIRELPQNLGFSATSMLAGLGVGVPLGLAPVPGAQAASWTLGMGASGAVAFRMAKDQFTNELHGFLNEQSKENRGREITKKEWSDIVKTHENAIREYGLWEAVPEAIGNAGALKIIRAPVDVIMKSPIMKNMIARATAKAAGIFGTELGTEVVTQMGQTGVEADIGMRDKSQGPLEAAKDVLPQVALLTGVMGGAGAVGSKVYDTAFGKPKQPEGKPPDEKPQEKDKKEGAGSFVYSAQRPVMTYVRTARELGFNWAEIEDVMARHRQAVIQGIENGQIIPGEVLWDYPDLQEAYDARQQQEEQPQEGPPQEVPAVEEPVDEGGTVEQPGEPQAPVEPAPPTEGPVPPVIAPQDEGTGEGQPPVASPEEPKPVEEPPVEEPQPTAPPPVSPGIAQEPKEPEPVEEPPAKEPADEKPKEEPTGGFAEDEEDLTDDEIGKIFGADEQDTPTAQMTRAAARSMSGKEFRDKFMKPAAERISKKAGTKDLQGIYDYYRRKYNTEAGRDVLPRLTIREVPDPVQVDYKGVGITGGWYHPMKREVRLSTFLKDEDAIVTLRHEIEHILDMKRESHQPVRGAKSSYEHMPGSAGPLLRGADEDGDYYEEEWGKDRVRIWPGHHKFFDVFNLDYPHRIAVKEALKRGEPVYEGAREDYPSLFEDRKKPEAPQAPETPEESQESAPQEGAPAEQQPDGGPNVIARFPEHDIIVVLDPYGGDRSFLSGMDYAVRGDKKSNSTFSIRKELKASGGAWDGPSKSWRFRDDPTDIVEEIINEKPLDGSSEGRGGTEAPPGGEGPGGHGTDVGEALPEQPEDENLPQDGSGFRGQPGEGVGGGERGAGVPPGRPGPGRPDGGGVGGSTVDGGSDITESPGGGGVPEGGLPPQEGGPRGTTDEGGTEGGRGDVGGEPGGDTPGTGVSPGPGTGIDDWGGFISGENLPRDPLDRRPPLEIPPGENGHVDADEMYNQRGFKNFLINKFHSWAADLPGDTKPTRKEFALAVAASFKRQDAPGWKIKRAGEAFMLFQADVRNDPSMLAMEESEEEAETEEEKESKRHREEMANKAKELARKEQAHAMQKAYVSLSEQESPPSRVPAAVEKALREGLSRLADELKQNNKYKDLPHGRAIDQFVADELNFTYDELYKGDSGKSRLMGTQVDAIALAIWSHKQGNTFVIGDQTGLGKGRAVAGMLRYAFVNDIVPVFITAKYGLYSDMHRDIYGIGWHDFTALPTDDFTARESEEETEEDSDTDERVVVGKGVMLPPRPGTDQKKLGDEFLVKPEMVYYDGKVMPYEDWYASAIQYHEEFEMPEIVEEVPGTKEGDNNRWRSTGRKYSSIFTSYGQLKPVADKKTKDRINAHLKERGLPPVQKGKGPTTNRRRPLFDMNASKMYFAMDESHKAGGSLESLSDPKEGKIPSTALWLRAKIKAANGALLSSATFSKNPETMTMLATTSVRHAVNGPQELYDLMVRGGDKLSQIVTEDLAKDLGMVRREQSFLYEGEPVLIPSVEYEVDAENAEQIFGAIRSTAAISMGDQLVKMIQAVATKEATKLGWLSNDGTATWEHEKAKLSYRALPIMQQYAMLAIKADSIIEEAVKARNEKDSGGNNHKPIVSVSFTQQAFFENAGIVVGDDVSQMSFADLFRRYQKRSFNFQLKNASLTKEQFDDDSIPDSEKFLDLNLEDLGVFREREYEDGGMRQIYDEGQEIYNQIDGLNLPLSPIDYIVHELAKRGIKMGEITGRSIQVNMETMKLEARDNSKLSDQQAMNSFNNDSEYHALIINRSAAEGISLHAAAEFNDQSGRWMIVGQPELDIFNHVQILGRIFRTGMVKMPRYSVLTSNVPQEKRYNAALQRKVSKMSAQTTGASGSALAQDEVDFINEYGVDAIVEAFASESRMRDALKYVGLSMEKVLRSMQSGSVEAAIGKITNRLSMLPVFNSSYVVDRDGGQIELPSQDEIYTSIIENYTNRIEALEAAGISIGDVPLYDLETSVIQSMGLAEETGTDSEFQKGVIAEQVSMNPITQPFRPIQVLEKIWANTEIKGPAPLEVNDKSLRETEEGAARYNEKLLADIQRRIDNENREYTDTIAEVEKEAEPQARVVEESETAVNVADSAVDEANTRMVDLKEQKKTAREEAKNADEAGKAAAFQRVGELDENIEQQEETIKNSKEVLREAKAKLKEEKEAYERMLTRKRGAERIINERMEKISKALRAVKFLGVGSVVDIKDNSQGGSGGLIAKGVIIDIKDKGLETDRDPFSAASGINESLQITVAMSRGQRVWVKMRPKDMADSSGNTSRWGPHFHLGRVVGSDGTPPSLKEGANMLVGDKKDKETRWILRGNALRSFKKYEELFGKVDPRLPEERRPMIVRYTNENGDVERGILLPPADDVLKAPIKLDWATNLEKYMSEGGSIGFIGDNVGEMFITVRNPRDPFWNNKLKKNVWSGEHSYYLGLISKRGGENRGAIRKSQVIRDIVGKSEQSTWYEGDPEKDLHGNMMRQKGRPPTGGEEQDIWYLRFPRTEFAKLIEAIQTEHGVSFFAHHNGNETLRNLAEKLAKSERQKEESPQDGEAEEPTGEESMKLSDKPAQEAGIFSPGQDKERARVVKGLQSILEQIAPNARLGVVDRMLRVVDGKERTVRGSYRDIEQLITVALNYDNPAATLRHEAIHALRSMGMFTRKEWNLLRKKAESSWRHKYDIDAKYGHLNEEKRNEEAIADAFSSYRRGENFPPGFKRMFKRLTDFLQRTGNMLRGLGFQTIEDVLGRVESGEVGRRKGTALPGMPGSEQYSLTAKEAGIVKGILNNIGADKKQPWKERVSEVLADKFVDRAKQSVADDLHFIKVMEEKSRLAVDGVQQLYEDSRSAYKLARLTRGINDLIFEAMFLGAPVWKEGTTTIDAGVKAPMGIMDEIGGERAEEFEVYLASRRAEELKAMDGGKKVYDVNGNLVKVGREALFANHDTAAAIDALDRKHPDFAGLFDDLQTYNGKILDFAQESGLLDADTRAFFDEMHKNYVPFFRITENGKGVKSPRSRLGFSGQHPNFYRLTGGKSKIEHPLINYEHNIHRLIEASIKNEVMRRAVDLNRKSGDLFMSRIGRKAKRALVTNKQMVDDLYEQGLEVTPEDDINPGALRVLWSLGNAPKGDNIVSVVEDGKVEFYEVDDPMLFRSFTMLHRKDTHALIKPLKKAKNLLTMMVGLDPSFQAANFVRDTMHASVISHKGFKPLIDSIKGIKSQLPRIDKDGNWVGGDEYWHEFLQAGAGMSALFEADRPSLKSVVKKFIRGEKASILENPSDYVGALQRIESTLEYSTRVGAFKKLRKDGVGLMEAAYQAREISTDFGMRGDYFLIRFLADTVPFFNAGLQGLYRTYRGAREGQEQTAKLNRAFMIKAGLVMAATTALWLSNEDDERFNDLTDYQRDTYWWFYGISDALGLKEPLKLPKPFEVGALFGSIPERTLDLLKKGEGKEFLQRMRWIMSEMFRFSIVPQAAVPIVRIYSNKDEFRERKILQPWEERLQPAEQYDDNTSIAARHIGRMTNVSPKYIETVIEGYFANIGAYGLNLADWMMMGVGDYPSKEAMMPSDIVALRRFVGPEVPKSSKAIHQFYEMREEAQSLHDTIQKLIADGEVKYAQELLMENRNKLAMRKSLNNADIQMRKLNRMMRAISSHKGMTGTEKRERKDEVRKVKMRLAKAMAQLKTQFEAD